MPVPARTRARAGNNNKPKKGGGGGGGWNSSEDFNVHKAMLGISGQIDAFVERPNKQRQAQDDNERFLRS